MHDMDLIIGDSIILNDHNTFCKKTIQEKLRNNRSIITTAKDYYRQLDFFNSLPIPVYISELSLDFNTEELINKLQS